MYFRLHFRSMTSIIQTVWKQQAIPTSEPSCVFAGCESTWTVWNESKIYRSIHCGALFFADNQFSDGVCVWISVSGFQRFFFTCASNSRALAFSFTSTPCLPATLCCSAAKRLDCLDVERPFPYKTRRGREAVAATHRTGRTATGRRPLDPDHATRRRRRGWAGRELGGTFVRARGTTADLVHPRIGTKSWCGRWRRRPGDRARSIGSGSGSGSVHSYPL
jgi:hypothetical protein